MAMQAATLMSPKTFLKLESEARERRKRLKKVVEQHKMLDSHSRKDILQRMEKLAQRGWRVHSFGWTNGIYIGWYALMVREIAL